MANDVVLVTGASSDIGVALVRRLLGDDAERTVLAHSFRGGAKIDRLAAEFSGRVVSLTADFSDGDSVRAMAEEILGTYGALQGVVHLPALRVKYERFTKVDWESVRQDLAVQVEAAGILLQKLLPSMSKRPGARVVLMLTSYVHGMPPKFLSPYIIVKYAQLGLMRALAAEYSGTKVRVNGVSPSMVETQFLGDLASQVVEMGAAANPMGRNATPEDLLGAILFLLGAGAEYVTGVDLPVAAGMVC